MAERILVTLTRPKSALALLDEIAALRAERAQALLRVEQYRMMLAEALDGTHCFKQIIMNAEPCLESDPDPCAVCRLGAVQDALAAAATPPAEPG